MRCSYLEIYNEDVRDLLVLPTDTKLELKENGKGEVYAKDLKITAVKSSNEIS